MSLAGTAERGPSPAGSSLTGARLEVRSVSKTFGRHQALSAVSLEVAPGEIHGLIGQNGSGKSTLAKILTGYHAPDPGGQVLVDGQQLRLPVRPREAAVRGLAVVHQSLGLVDDLTVVENLRVGRFRANRLTRAIRWDDERRDAEAVLERLGRPVRLDVRVAELSEEERATVAIARALQDATPGRGLVVFDESTRSLSRASLEHFYDLLEDVVATGTAALLISHHMEEVLEATDRVTVLRDGVVVEGGLPTAGLTENDLVRAIMGRSLEQLPARPACPRRRVGDAVTVRGLRGELLDGVDLELHPGEVVGVTGLAGSGHDELPYLLTGARPARDGTLQLGDDTHDLARFEVGTAMAAGVALVPEGREHAGLALDLTVADNVLLPRRRSRSAVLPVERSAETAVVGEWVQRLDVRPPDPAQVVGKLSGGNQQKVLLAKWLATAPRLLVLHEPTQAVDVGARRTIGEAVRRAADEGCAVLVAGTDETELTMLCDRVLVFRDGRPAAELTGDFTPDEVVEAIFSGHIRKRLRSASPPAGDG
ncbi:sugar ABC transporter ATP-binding protein [Blastococcus tunisiensis]|uniref:Monosaccharide ABC transporter ATP-binding protein, CUT2 family n=1 Tax=Blastococcus tunisiensis TaxID=1798228 RepID=A0A1I2DXU1_9ACTN|nr:sugar ABC transporter ATP-binding protein [Blastococcus sp. DSM 46838]SFE85149.1 monosaccharide ABC transporter ATP-binding protein, CUT2 family [Blastococcus sp. DSM 46838]